MASLCASSISGSAQKLQEVNENHDDINIKHQSANDVLVQVQSISSERGALANLHGVNDQEYGVEEEGQGAVHDV